MTFQNLNGRGQLFKNDRKAGDSDPDYRGELRIEDTDYWISGWINTSKSGAKYMRLSARPRGAGDRRRDQPSTAGDIA
jgi:hypothetical protein